jgi:hypothetical protein
MSDKQPIFEEYPPVTCENCKSYWDETCDGTPVGTERLCKAFKATRRVDIPLQIQSLQNACTWLLWGYVGNLLLFVGHVCLHAMGCV